MQVQIIHRQSFSERLFFASKPDAKTRAALRLAGWKWDRAGNWWRNTQSCVPIRLKQLNPLLTPANDNIPQPEQAVA